MKLSDLKSGLTIANEKVIIDKIEMKETKNGKPYASIVINLGNDEIIYGRIWDNCLKDSVKIINGITLLIKSGKVNEYNNNKQIIVEDYDISDEKPKNVATSTCATTDIDKMFNEMFDEQQFEGNDAKTLIATIKEDAPLMELFKKSPGAMSVHHDFPGGLCQHTYEVYNIARFIGADLYNGGFSNFYELDLDLLLCGAILHDIGNMFALDGSGKEIKSTTEGKLFSHVYLGAEYISGICSISNISEDFKNRIVHIVLSHMGRLDWGAQVEPKTAEAFVVHFCDNISAKIGICYKSLKNANKGDFITNKTIGEIMK